MIARVNASSRAPLLAAHHSLLTILTAHCSLLTAHYSLLTTHYSLLTAYYSLLTTRYSQWPGTADAHPAIRALQRLLAELLATSEPGAEVVAAEAAGAAGVTGETAAETAGVGGAEVGGSAGTAGAAALGGARTATAFEVTMSSTSNLLPTYSDPLTQLL